MNNWKINDNILSFLTDNGKTIVLPASILVKIIFTDELQFAEYPSIVFHNPEQDIPNLRFSRKYPKVIGQVSLLPNWKISLDFFIQTKSTTVSLNLLHGLVSDHIVIDNVWYSLVNPISTINSILESAGITNIGDISVADYMQLRKVVTDFSNTITWIDKAAPEHLLDKLDREKITVPQEFTGKLYPYQKDGYFWMKHFTNGECGCILADEMGLGKTIQVIALIVSRRNTALSPALVVCPVSLLENWRREILKFTKGIKVYTYHGFGAVGDTDPLLEFDIVLTTYEMVATYLTSLNKFEWDLVILDEAQYIKTPNARRTGAVKKLRKKCGIAISGTPFENRLTDIWSITDFVYPEYLGSLKDFNNLIWDSSLERAQEIEPLVRPLLLRRRVSEVADDLPKRIDIPIYLELDQQGAQMYEEIRNKILKDNPSAYMLEMLVKLRMFCTHPFVYDKKINGDLCVFSRKYQAFCNIVDKIVANHEKFIVFTSFNMMNDMLVSDISQRWQIPVYSINGNVPSEIRQDIIDTFSKHIGSAGMILHPKSAGIGLNITAANNVIHYNPEWNPAVEDQASARAYRRGQNKIVRIYRLIYVNTVEEIMDERLTKKRQISDVLVIGNKGDSNRDDLIRALKISPFH